MATEQRLVLRSRAHSPIGVLVYRTSETDSLAGPSKCDVFAPLPPYVVVPHGATKIETEVTVLKTATLGPHRIGAWTANSQRPKPPSGALQSRFYVSLARPLSPLIKATDPSLYSVPEVS